MALVSCFIISRVNPKICVTNVKSSCNFTIGMTSIYNSTTTTLLVDTSSTRKIVFLPVASTVGAGRLLWIKDISGNAAVSSIFISTIGMDRIENRFMPSTLFAVLSSSYGSVLMTTDGILNWYILQHYYRNAISLGSTSSFTPTSIGGINHWYDATDSSTIILSSGLLTQWNDKSGSGRNLTAISGLGNATVSSAYQNGLNVFNFSANGLYRTALGNVSYPMDVYIIVALKSLTTHVDVLGMGDTGSDNFNSLTFAESAASRWHNGSSSGARQTISTSNETSLSFLLIQWSIANGNYLLRRNGTQLVQASQTYSFNNASTSAFQIGFRHTNINSANFSGYIGEIVVFNTQLATTPRQQIEGYLAWKWGLQAGLPAGHPYLSSAP